MTLDLGSQPPISYQTLKFLIKNNFTHKIKQLNTFITYKHLAENHTPVFLICQTYNSVTEIYTNLTQNMLGHTTKTINFQIEQTTIEVEGIYTTYHKKNKI